MPIPTTTLKPTDARGYVNAFLAAGALPLSRSVSRVQAMLHEANYCSADLAEHMRLDPTLTARVMAVANSAFFGNQPCGTIGDAVNRLGANQLTRIFAQVLVHAVQISPLRAYGRAAKDLWRRSVFAAVGAERAAGQLGQDRSIAYMVGLLHEVGMLVLNHHWTKQDGAKPLLWVDFGQEYSADEESRFGFNQAVVGAELLRQLSFPESVYRVVGRQYHPPLGPLPCALHVGRLARSFACDGIRPQANEEALQALRITSPRQLETLLNEIRQEALIRIQGDRQSPDR